MCIGGVLRVYWWCVECVLVVCWCRKGKMHMDMLKQESEDSKWKNMTPRERMRIKKMQKADEEAERLK